MPRIGEKNSGSQTSASPIDDTHSAARMPTNWPMPPASADPIASTPVIRNRIVAFIRPSNRCGVTRCRKLIRMTLLTPIR